MSQIIKNLAAGPVPPTVATSYVTDDGTAIPAGNVLNVLGQNGIVTSADPDLSNNLFISLQNSMVDTTQTIGAVTADVITVPLTANGTYTFEVRVAAWKIAGGVGDAGAGYSINGVIRVSAGVATLIGDSDGFAHSDAELDDADVNIIASGSDAIVRVLGVAGLTINWGAFSVYVFRGV